MSAACIVLGVVLVPVSIVAGWARVQLVDEDSFVALLAPLASDDDVQTMVVDQTMSAVTAKVDFAALTDTAIDGIASLGLPAAAASALDLLRAPAAAGLESLVQRAVTDVVSSDAFAGAWATAVRGAHRGLVTAATSDGGGVVVRTPEGVGVQLGGIVEQVRRALTAQGSGLASLVPEVDRVVVLSDGDGLAALRTGYAVAVAAGLWLPPLTLGVLALGVGVARRRAAALVGIGLGAGAAAAALAVALALVPGAGSALPAEGGIPAAFAAIAAQVTATMRHTAQITAVIGGVLAVLAWSRTGARTAVALRGLTSAVNDGIRRALARHGVRTGARGVWLSRHRGAVVATLCTLATVWLALMRPLSIGDVALVLVTGLLAWWLIELARQPVDAAEPVDAADPDRAAAPDAG